ncbi:MAG: HEPN domain-containing protein, partial [Desulfurococcaceae archaeon]
ACFESHQAAEKAIKALLNYLHKERRGHSLLFLLSEALVEVPEEIKQCVLYLDKHYIPSRYPDVYDEGTPSDYYTKEDAERCLSCMSKIIDWVKSTVK